MKLKSSGVTRIASQAKRQPTEWDKTFTSYKYDGRQISKQGNKQPSFKIALKM